MKITRERAGKKMKNGKPEPNGKITQTQHNNCWSVSVVAFFLFFFFLHFPPFSPGFPPF